MSEAQTSMFALGGPELAEIVKPSSSIDIE